MGADPNTATRLRAILGYYRFLGEQTARARRKDMLPSIPPYEELQYVDGWVVWNGRPVWSLAQTATADARPDRGSADLTPAESAWLAAGDHWAAAVEAKAALGDKSSDLRDRIEAECRFYESLDEQARQAMCGEGSIPEVPDRSELEFVNGWLVWKGQPVWWSGERTGGSASPGVSTLIESLPVAVSAPARERPKLRRLLALPWRRAAA